MLARDVLTKDSATRLPRVLVVEDDHSVSRMLRLSLNAAGFETTAVSTGGDALRPLDSDDVDAVVLDLGLPDNLGGEVVERLRGGLETSTPVWVVISALDAQEATSRYGQLGTHFISKPFDPWDLVGLLKDQLGIV